MEQRYVDINGRYWSNNLYDVLQTRGDPIIGHRITDRFTRFTKRRVFSHPTDVHFQEYIKPFLNAVAFSYDTPPLKNIYLKLKEIEKSVEIQKSIAETSCERAHEPSLEAWLVLNSPTVKDRRMERLQARYQHQLVRNARMILEDMCSSYL